MKKYRVRLAEAAEQDLVELQAFLADHDPTAARRAITIMKTATRLLASLPFTCRMNETAHDPFIRELLVPFGNTGYVKLFEIDDSRTVTILAVRHQREGDYH